MPPNLFFLNDRCNFSQFHVCSPTFVSFISLLLYIKMGPLYTARCCGMSVILYTPSWPQGVSSVYRDLQYLDEAEISGSSVPWLLYSLHDTLIPILPFPQSLSLLDAPFFFFNSTDFIFSVPRPRDNDIGCRSQACIWSLETRESVGDCIK